MALPIESGIHISLNGATWYKLTDHNRNEIDIVPEVIEKSARMANGTLRKYVVDTKDKISVSWQRIPSLSTYTVDSNYSSEWLEAFYNANVSLPIYVKIVGATGTIPSIGSIPVDGNPVEEKTYQCFITNFSKNIVWRTKQSLDLDNNPNTPKTLRRVDFVNMSIEFTEI